MTTREVRGTCEECRATIYVGEGYEMVRESHPVRGRIGAPSDEITGIVQGPKIYTCGGCVALRDAGRGER